MVAARRFGRRCQEGCCVDDVLVGQLLAQDGRAHRGEHLRLLDGVHAQVGFQVQVQVRNLDLDQSCPVRSCRVPRRLPGRLIRPPRLPLPALLLAPAMGLFSLIEIKASRPYKELKRRADRDGVDQALMERYEMLLKCVSLGVIVLAAGLLLWRITG